ncbi:VOC family protein [Pseudorhodoferax sp.]|uniref:VOC family protein n=1 Tax=Pseudorhodoferax sp. TaxID=1993553 RepID=UPI002DD642DF|nr:VOC family protein [Pseudorhodoferax sp.]
MAGSRIDHLAITAPTLQAGSDAVFAQLGVRPQPGGQHARMGTHNLLLRLGEALYLEVIAVDPQAPAPARPRWFGLDALGGNAPPRLACWVARTGDIAAAAAAAPLGEVLPMSRGALQWRITVPADGSLPLGGAAPALIQWDTAVHPAATLPDQGCTLVALELQHPEPARVQAVLDQLRLAEPGVALSLRAAPTPGLLAQVRTPAGLRWLA